MEALALSGNAQAEPTIRALQDGKLFVAPDKSLWIKHDGATVNARTGAAGEPPGPLKAVRLNNAVRRAVDAAMGDLTLRSHDPAARAKAAEAVFKSHDPAALPALTRALAKEQDPGVRRAMEQARAAVVLTAPGTPEADRLAAVATLSARGDLDAVSVLASLAHQPPAVATAGATARSRTLMRSSASEPALSMQPQRLPPLTWISLHPPRLQLSIHDNARPLSPVPSLLYAGRMTANTSARDRLTAALTRIDD
ncbi:MAG: hypothetical protein J0I21_14250, partial [Alphaproteobacteria bacterium]|nr:hypothetical protein [Alphaproteobacteria bacterium]